MGDERGSARGGNGDGRGMGDEGGHARGDGTGWAMRAALRRVRAYAGHLGLLAALGLVAALLAGGMPRLANGYTDRGLQGDVGRLPYQVRDLTFRAEPQVAGGILPAVAAGQLAEYAAGLPAPLSELVQESWFVGGIDSPQVRFTGPAPFTGVCPPRLSVRTQTGYDRAIRMREGRLPRSPSGSTEAVVSREAAALVGLRVGGVLTMSGVTGSAPLRIVGIFDPVASAAPFWDGQWTGTVPCPDPREGMRSQTTVLTDLAGITVAGRATGELAFDWRFRLDTARLAASEIPALTTAVAEVRRTPSVTGIRMVTGLDGALREFEAQLGGAQAVLAVVRAGLLATMVGLILLAALLMADRRREESALLRARGGGTTAVVRRALAETLLVVPAAVLAGWSAGALVPGRPERLEIPLVAGLAAVALLAPAVLAARPAARRGRVRPSARRLAAELFVLLLAVLGVLLARRRGLTGAVDPYLVSVPVLLAVAAALVAVRLLPWPLRQLGRITARGRGVVPFLGLARAGRGVPAHVGPLAILVVAMATGVFTAAVSGTISGARDRASDQEIAADARLIGSAYAPDTAARLAALPGVTAVTPLLVESGAPVTGATGTPAQAQLLVVDGVAAGKAMTAAGIETRFPAALSAAATDGPAAAVVSPELAAQIGAGGVVVVQGRRFEFRVAAMREALPGLQVGTRRFIALPWQALPVPDFQPIVPNRFLVAGRADPGELRRVADAGQRAYRSRLLGHEVTSDAALPLRTSVTTWAAHRQELEESGVNAVLAFTFAAGATGSVALALLAVGLTVLADAPGRGRSLSRLRTMGLSLGQGRRLLMYELVPLVGVAVAAGGAVGVALPRLIAPALALDGFTAGVEARTRVDPLVPLVVLLLIAAALGTAILVESLVNRRMRLGEVLRLGEES
jgi:putative ABC transport system permease protein